MVTQDTNLITISIDPSSVKKAFGPLYIGTKVFRGQPLIELKHFHKFRVKMTICGFSLDQECVVTNVKQLENQDSLLVIV